MKKELTNKTEILVRFNEADPLGIVWHGHYIRYFEDGREAFGNMHELEKPTNVNDMTTRFLEEENVSLVESLFGTNV